MAYQSKRERRSKRQQILITETLYAAIAAEAEAREASVNDTINRVLESYFFGDRRRKKTAKLALDEFSKRWPELTGKGTPIKKKGEEGKVE